MKNFGLKEGLFITLGILVVATPFLAFGGHDVIYVDRDATGTETGSNDTPYQTIGAALDHAGDGAEVRVKNGEYKENIVIPNGVQVVSDSDDNEKVSIIGKNSTDATVVMKDGAKLSHVTVEDGRHGIRIDKNAEAHIYDVIVSGSDRDGIHIDESKKKDKRHRVFIDKVEVKKNGKAGIYSEDRFVVITNTTIHDNGLDGIDFQNGVKAWIENTKIDSNKGSGMKINLNGADIWTNKVTIRDNKHEGVEVFARTNELGNFGLKKATITGNKNFGVAKLRRGTASAALLNQHVFVDGSRVESNGKGVVSGAMLVK